MGLFGKPQYHAEANNGWEPFSNSTGDDWCAADWAKLIRRAEGMGVKVEFTPKGIKMVHGKSEGTFKDYKGGVRMAEQFLEGIA